MTMATPGQSSFCFSCGQPLPADVTSKAAPLPQAAAGHVFPPTGAQPMPPPPPNPYGLSSVLLSSSHGSFQVSTGGDVLVGRDPARCAIHLTEPRVSGVHATLKIERGALWVRDEASNNGVWINGHRIGAGEWAQVPTGAELRFGPIVFSVSPT
jgi:hypothetical protein